MTNTQLSSLLKENENISNLIITKISVDLCMHLLVY